MGLFYEKTGRIKNVFNGKIDSLPPQGDFISIKNIFHKRPPCGRHAETKGKMCLSEPLCPDESGLPERAVPDCWGALWMRETPGLPACSAEIGEERPHVRLS